MGLIFLIAIIANIAIIGGVTFLIINVIFGDRSFGRLIKVIAIPTCCLLYLYLMSWANDEASFWLGILIYFGPIGLAVLLTILAYIFEASN